MPDSEHCINFVKQKLKKSLFKMCVPVSRYYNTLLFGHLIVTVGSTAQNIPLTSL